MVASSLDSISSLKLCSDLWVSKTDAIFHTVYVCVLLNSLVAGDSAGDSAGCSPTDFRVYKVPSLPN